MCEGHWAYVPISMLGLSTWSGTGVTVPLSAMPIFHFAESFIMLDISDISPASKVQVKSGAHSVPGSLFMV